MTLKELEKYKEDLECLQGCLESNHQPQSRKVIVQRFGSVLSSIVSGIELNSLNLPQEKTGFTDTEGYQDFQDWISPEKVTPLTNKEAS